MKKMIFCSGFAVALFLVAPAAFAKAPLSSMKCASESAQQAEKILRFFYEVADGEEITNHTPPTAADVTPLLQEKRGKGLLQVLSVSTGIYKAQYNAVLKYAELKDPSKPNGIYCLLLSQQITDLSTTF